MFSFYTRVPWQETHKIWTVYPIWLIFSWRCVKWIETKTLTVALKKVPGKNCHRAPSSPLLYWLELNSIQTFREHSSSLDLLTVHFWNRWWDNYTRQQSMSKMSHFLLSKCCRENCVRYIYLQILQNNNYIYIYKIFHGGHRQIEFWVHRHFPFFPLSFETLIPVWNVHTKTIINQ